MASRSRYQVVFSDSAVESFAGLSRREQRRVLDRANELAADPFLIPDFRTQDTEEREICHIMVDEFIFDFWVDHAVKQVIVTEIEQV